MSCVPLFIFTFLNNFCYYSCSFVYTSLEYLHPKKVCEESKSELVRKKTVVYVFVETFMKIL